MKPGHTIFFKDDEGYRKAVVHMAVGFDPNEKGHAINLTTAIRISALSKYEDFNIKQGRDFVDHEKKYMNSNSKLYERS